jgi:uncharacterized Zn finger protein (UPF0148 family)
MIKTFCPHCNRIVFVDRYGFIECGHCGKHFLTTKRLDGYLRAVENGTVKEYHDRQDKQKSYGKRD